MAKQKGPDIITIGCDDYSKPGTLQRRNKTKGTAQQKLIAIALDIQRDDISINTLLEQMEDKARFIYRVETPVKINSTAYPFRRSYISQKDIPPHVEAYAKEITSKPRIVECDKCGNRILASKKQTRKCRKCGEGWFHLLPKKPWVSWKPLLQAEKPIAILRLMEHGYLKPVRITKRPDIFHYRDGVITVFESKNKECTSLRMPDFFETLKYPRLLDLCGHKTKELHIVYNGTLDKDLSRYISGRHPYIGEIGQYPYRIRLIPIRRFLREHGVYWNHVRVEKGKKGYLYHMEYLSLIHI